MLAGGKIRYVPGYRVRRYAETADGVAVEATELSTEKPVTFRARHIVLALGALNTPRLVLHSAGDTAARLPIVENPVSFAPLVGLRLLGQPIATSAYSSQLNFSYQGALHPTPVIGMLYGVDGLLRSDILFKFPLALRGCMAASRLVLPATLLLQVFYAGEPRPENRLGVDVQGNLLVEHAAHELGGVERHLLSAFRRLGFFGFARTVHLPRAGGSIHYGGALPMREGARGPYETDRDGRLGGSRRVFVADSSTFPRLPAKNLTFTIMANALRVGAAVRRQLEGTP
jgi:choline dehydrogenase-like flavoprotein